MEKNTITGRIVKVHPAGSRVVIATDKPVDEAFISSVKIYFIEIEGKYVPFFPEYSEVRGDNTILVSFEDYKEPGKLRMLTGCRILIRSEEKPGEQPFNIYDLTGYTLTATGKDLSGSITRVTDYNGSIILDVATSKDKSILIPYHEDLVVEINSEKREIKMQLPDGLSDLNDRQIP